MNAGDIQIKILTFCHYFGSTCSEQIPSPTESGNDSGFQWMTTESEILIHNNTISFLSSSMR